MKSAQCLVMVAAVVASAIAQVPFTARQGLEAAMQHAGVTEPPTALGAVNELREQGKATSWAYAFRKEGTLIGVSVRQEMAGEFVAFLLSSVDTNNLPIIVNADPLPVDFIDSDSAMAIVAGNSVYQEWTAQYGKDPTTERLIAGRLREPYPMPIYTPVWIYSVTATDGVNRLMCWCTVDGSAHGCETGMVEGAYRFSVQEGLEFSQQTAGTTEQPCLVAAEGADTTGRAPAWYYAFPVGDSVVAVFTQGLAEGIYHAVTVPLMDTTGNDMPLYVRATPFAGGWINSTAALEQMRRTEVFRQWVAVYRYDSTRTILLGGRLRENIPVPQGTAVWLLGTQAIGNPDVNLYCWCNLEPLGEPFTQCVAELVSAPPLQSGLAVVIAPNPASEAAVVRLGDERKIDQVMIFDLHGKMHAIPQLVHGSIAWLDLSSLSTGSYSVVVQAGGMRSRQLLQVIR